MPATGRPKPNVSSGRAANRFPVRTCPSSSLAERARGFRHSSPARAEVREAAGLKHNELARADKGQELRLTYAAAGRGAIPAMPCPGRAPRPDLGASAGAPFFLDGRPTRRTALGRWRAQDPGQGHCRLGIPALAKRLVLHPIGTHDNFLRAARRAAQREGEIRHADMIREAVNVDGRLVLARITGSIDRTDAMLPHVAEGHRLDFLAFSVRAARVSHVLAYRRS